MDEEHYGPTHRVQDAHGEAEMGNLDHEMIEHARGIVRQQFGSDLAEKATPEFLRSFTRSVPRSANRGIRAFGLEAMAASVPAAPASVVEFARPELDQRLLSPSALDEASRGALRDVVESVGPEVARIDPTVVVRDAAVRTLREAFYRQSGAVTDELERAGGASLRGLESTGSGGPSPITHTCWLNGTVRTSADPASLANVAGDPAVDRVDVPRRLEAEVTGTSEVVGVKAFRGSSSVTGAGVIVGVIDGEVSLSHPALTGRVIHRRNYTEEPWGHPHSHGTAVAGIVAASSDALTGMAPGATIYNYKILGEMPINDADDFFGWRAIQDALEDGARIVNCSWGAGPAGDGSSREARACNWAWGLGLVTVKSAGNRGPLGGTLTTPADADGVIVVGATDRSGTAIGDYSSRGPTPSGQQRPHLVAPGGNPEDGIISLLVDGSVGSVEYGTSFAAPHVSGIAALLLQLEPDLTSDELRAKLIGLCTPLAGVDGNAQGAGLVKL